MKRTLALLLAALLSTPAGAAAPRVSVPQARLSGTGVGTVQLNVAPATLLLAAPGAAPAFRPELTLTPPVLAALPAAPPVTALPAALPAAERARESTQTLLTRVLARHEPAQGRREAAPAAREDLELGAELAGRAPADFGRLYDAAPQGPDFGALSPVVEPARPAAWRPSWSLLKPAAALYNAARERAYERRVANAGPGQRVTVEEHGLRESLAETHAALEEGRLQHALTPLIERFESGAAKAWFRANGEFERYRSQAMAYYRFAERAVLAAYGRGHKRSSDDELVAEALAAERAGALVGHGWRRTALQAKDLGHCATHALYNAIAASVGFAVPTRVEDLIDHARWTMNVKPAFNKASARETARFEAQLGVKFGRDIDHGMGEKDMVQYASRLGLRLSPRAPPADEAGWLALLRGGDQTLLSYRMFHPRFRQDEDGSPLDGHDYRVLHHAAYLLGAFPSPSRRAWLFMVQDSGSGITAFLSAEELSALTKDVQALETRGPVRLPPVAVK